MPKTFHVVFLLISCIGYCLCIYELALLEAPLTSIIFCSIEFGGCVTTSYVHDNEIKQWSLHTQIYKSVAQDWFSDFLQTCGGDGVNRMYCDCS